MIARIERAVWVSSFRLEEARQSAAAKGQLWKQAGACILLALLRIGGAYV